MNGKESIYLEILIFSWKMTTNVQFIEEKQEHPLEVKFFFTELWANGVSDRTTMVTIAGFSSNQMVGSLRLVPCNLIEYF